MERESLKVFEEALAKLEAGFADLPAFDESVDIDRLRSVLMQVAERLNDNFPYHHPLYAGQMLKPPHPVVRLAYWLAMFINPNNHALDGGRASSAMEKEAVAEIARMFGFAQNLGHLTSSGTIANLEALWISGQERDGVILASGQAHYTHSRISAVLKLPFDAVAVDKFAHMDMNALEARLKKGDASTVVATLGTTAAGAVDPLHEIIPLARKYGVRVHVDAAYGGYFTLASNLDDNARRAFDAIPQADSLVVDPHKHGLQPYGCGCVLFADPSLGKHYKHDSPYTYFSSDELHLGEISLECSRAGASAVALWATQKLLPLEQGGEFARGLEQGRDAAVQWREMLQQDGWRVAMPPELDILLFADSNDDSENLSRASNDIFQRAEKNNLHLAIARFPRALLEPWWPDLEWRDEQASVLRSCLMKPQHAEWLPEIHARLSTARR
ncbi:MAG TPA: aminotransferase class I/II-fold pyridoxal phosphate-dependent enzyme [Gammaproteobacteria bacterium]